MSGTGKEMETNKMAKKQPKTEAEKRKITVEIPQKSYNLIRRHSESTWDKTARVLSRYLFMFLRILSDGEQTLYRKFTQAQARELAFVLNHIHCADDVSWDELSMYPAENLGTLVGMFDASKTVPISTVSALNAFEIVALMEYAQCCDAAQFEAQTACFRG